MLVSEDKSSGRTVTWHWHDVLSSCMLLAAFLCSLVAGLLLTFAIVVMPGIGKLEDGDFIRAFQVIDRVIQNNQPLFVFVWVGSVLALVAATILGIQELGGTDRLLVVGAALIYLLGVQLPTAAFNIPMNNRLQKVDLSAISEMMRRRTRSDFELRWNRWNTIRAACSSLASILLLFLLLRL